MAGIHGASGSGDAGREQGLRALGLASVVSWLKWLKKCAGEKGNFYAKTFQLPSLLQLSSAYQRTEKPALSPIDASKEILAAGSRTAILQSAVLLCSANHKAFHFTLQLP